jgi:hypothetical protein
MMAYAKCQFTEISNEEVASLRAALLKYCELDTLAMVMLWQTWKHDHLLSNLQPGACRIRLVLLPH